MLGSLTRALAIIQRFWIVLVTGLAATALAAVGWTRSAGLLRAAIQPLWPQIRAIVEVGWPLALAVAITILWGSMWGQRTRWRLAALYRRLLRPPWPVAGAVLTLTVLVLSCVFLIPALMLPPPAAPLRELAPTDRIKAQNDRLKARNDMRTALLQGRWRTPACRRSRRHLAASSDQPAAATSKRQASPC